MKYESRSERSIAVDDTVIEFPTKIQAAVALDDRIVVLLNNAYWSETDPERARNVYCYGTGGKLLARSVRKSHLRAALREEDRHPLGMRVHRGILAFGVPDVEHADAVVVEHDLVVIRRHHGRVRPFRRRCGRFFGRGGLLLRRLAAPEHNGGQKKKQCVSHSAPPRAGRKPYHKRVPSEQSGAL